MNNRRRGLAFERKVIKMLAERLGIKAYDGKCDDYDICSSRFASKRIDDMGVDIICTVPPLSQYSIQVYHRTRSKPKTSRAIPRVSLKKLIRIWDMPNPTLIVGDSVRHGSRIILHGIYVVVRSDGGGEAVRGESVPLLEGRYRTPSGLAVEVFKFNSFIKKLKP